MDEFRRVIEEGEEGNQKTKGWWDEECKQTKKR